LASIRPVSIRRPLNLIWLGEQHATCNSAAPRRDHGNARALGHLPFAGFATQLQDGFMDEPEPVRPARRQSAAVGVERQFPIASDGVVWPTPVMAAFFSAMFIVYSERSGVLPTGTRVGSGSKRGKYTSSSCWNVTRTGMPM
jgi:hypothetical protein